MDAMTETNAGSPSALLLYPPLTDPTAPYHSLIYVASYARSRGFASVEVRDTNLEALDYCARPEVLGRMLRAWGERRRRLSARPSLTGAEQLEYSHLVRAGALEPESAARAIAVLRDPEAFYDYPRYRRAAWQVELWLRSLSCEAFPGQFPDGSFARLGALFNTSGVADLTDAGLLERVVGPFREYYREVLFPELLRRPYDLIGINVTYTSQLPYALWLVRELRRLLPGVFLVCGGTEVSDVWKYAARPDVFAQVFRGADACVVGEGETAFVRLLESLGDGGQTPIPNVVRLDRRGDVCAPPPSIAYEDLDRLPTPDYGLMDSARYFSPHLFYYYSPTRGCYWNKCTFCDYGLNFGTPTSPWRQRDLELVVADLREISQKTPYVYLSVDVLAPGALLRLAEAVIDAGIRIRWAAEMRLEKYFNRERCETLRRSGCVAVSVGFESGNQRILDRIKKGTRLEEIEGTLGEFAGSGIAVQMMGFTGFPTETYREALESISYLKRNSEHWAVGGLGEFVLTPGAIVAQRPADFNVSNVRPFAGDDIKRCLNFDELPGPAKTAEETLAVEEAKRELRRAEFSRPFAGGTDSAHSIFYYARYGLDFPRTVVTQDSPGPLDENAPLALDGALLTEERYDLLSLFDQGELEGAHARARAAQGAALDAADVRALLLGQEPALPVGGENPYLLRRDGTLIPCSYELLDLLSRVDGRRTLGEIRAAIAPRDAEREVIYDLLARAMWRLRVLVPAGRQSEAGAHPEILRVSERWRPPQPPALS
jgi:hypothetical protein